MTFENHPTPPQLVWLAHGSPAVDGCVPASGRCYLCAGVVERGMAVAKWMGANFTDQTRARAPASQLVCEACVYVCSRTSPVLGRPAKDGKKFGANFRNVSHLYEQGWDSPAFAPEKDEHGRVIALRGTAGLGYINASKGDKDYIRAFLAREHSGVWFAAIADSAQKHVLPYALLNGPGRAGRVQFDDVIVQVPDDQALIDRMTALLTAGATKEEIGSGDYSPRAWQLCGDALLRFEEEHGLTRGGDWFTLALWLAQRDEEAVAARLAAEKEAKKNAKRATKGASKNPDRRGDSRRAGGVSGKPRGQRTEALGSAPGPNASRGADHGEPGGVGDQAPARSESRSAEQGRLPGFD